MALPDRRRGQNGVLAAQMQQAARTNHASAQCCEPPRVRHAATNSVLEDAAVRPKAQRWLMLCLQCAKTARNPSRMCIVSDTIPDSAKKAVDLTALASWKKLENGEPLSRQAVVNVSKR
jgi:hypothetical protein